MNKISKLRIAGFKTLKDVELKPGNINVFIGPNGSGKSNLISLFRMLHYMFASPSGNLQSYIGMQGGAGSLLHDGPKTTPALEIEFTLQTDMVDYDYYCRLVHAAGDTMIFGEERCHYFARKYPQQTNWVNFDTGHRESKVFDHAVTIENVDWNIDNISNIGSQTLLWLMQSLVVYQFHDTSTNSRIRGKWSATDNKYLKVDGANLGSFLLNMREHSPDHYRVIVDTIRLVAPFFNDFELYEESGAVLLRWRENGTDQIFDASQASDGLLRAMALISLLGQPPETIPDVIIIDEPELGLHPFAIGVITGMIRNVTRTKQVFLSTQSVPFIDEFDPEDIIVVERTGRETTLTRLDPVKLQDWLKEYSLSELWEKNVLGGRP